MNGWVASTKEGTEINFLRNSTGRVNKGGALVVEKYVDKTSRQGCHPDLNAENGTFD